MQFVVRYWSPLLPLEHREVDGTPRLVDYSTHPPSKMGLHNALLSQHDRIEILRSHGGSYQCEVFVVEGSSARALTREAAMALFRSLPHGEVRWTDIGEFLLPERRLMPHPVAIPVAMEDTAAGRQFQLFEYSREAYAEIMAPHELDTDA
ncbi:hypothetical protein GALL_283550 [mine drainage metagenome]|uniref:Uncharacterized protein n=1 Tax=mine drainage metagenome TaxID=410659 RepID=A0A1J5RJJ4_9ZZZZ